MHTHTHTHTHTPHTWASPVVKKKNLPINAGYARDKGSIRESGRYPGVGSGNPL